MLRHIVGDVWEVAPGGRYRRAGWAEGRTVAERPRTVEVGVVAAEVKPDPRPGDLLGGGIRPAMIGWGGGGAPADGADGATMPLPLRSRLPGLWRPADMSGLQQGRRYEVAVVERTGGGEPLFEVFEVS